MSSYPAPPLTPIPSIVPNNSRRQTIASSPKYTPKYTPKYFSNSSTTPKQVQFADEISYSYSTNNKENSIPYSPLLKINTQQPGTPSYAKVAKEGPKALNGVVVLNAPTPISTPTIAPNKNLSKAFDEIERFSLFEEDYNDTHNNFYPVSLLCNLCSRLTKSFLKSSLFIKKLDAIDDKNAKAQNDPKSTEDGLQKAPATPGVDTPRRNSIRAGGASRVKGICVDFSTCC
jgi:hypothetical protein